MFFSSQPMGSARSSREHATLRVELQDNSYFKEEAPGKSVLSIGKGKIILSDAKLWERSTYGSWLTWVSTFNA